MKGQGEGHAVLVRAGLLGCCGPGRGLGWDVVGCSPGSGLALAELGKVSSASSALQ